MTRFLDRVSSLNYDSWISPFPAKGTLLDSRRAFRPARVVVTVPA
jgi:hypothetical protein